MRRLSMTALLLASAVLGCGGNEFSTAPVAGTVMCEGNPVNGGTVSFSPIPEAGNAISGKTGYAEVGPDGKFAVSTYGDQDGAVIGKHRVSYRPPETEEELDAKGRPKRSAKRLPCARCESLEIEVKPSGNDLTLEFFEG